MGLPFPISPGGSGLATAGAINSFAILQQHMTAYELKKMKDAIGDRLIDIARVKGIGAGPGEVTVRDVSPLRDLLVALFPAEDWVSAAATVANAQYLFVNTVLVNNKALCIYGFWSRDAIPNIVRVRCQGAGGSTTYLDVDVSGIYSSLEQTCYFSTPIFYAPTSTVRVELYSRVAAVSVSGLMAMVVEPQGDYLSRATT